MMYSKHDYRSEELLPIPVPKGDKWIDPEGTGNQSMAYFRVAKVPGTGTSTR